MDGAHCIVFCFLRKHKAWNNRADVRRSCQRRRGLWRGERERYGLHASAGARTKGTAQWRRRHLLIVCCLQCVSGRLTCRHRLLLLLRTCHCDTSRRVSKSNEVKCPSLSVPLSLSSVYVSARWLRQLRVPTTCAKKKGGKITRRKYNRMVDHAVQQTPL